MGKDIHEIYMSRCLELASLGKGMVEPNPLVGAVIVKDNRIIGEGYHFIYGGAHAEVNAISSVKERSELPFSTLYVNLEPCSHYGKTPPCSELIAELKIPRVVVGSKDPNPLVSGKGTDFLNKHNVVVISGVMHKASIALNKRHYTFHTKKRPYVILKWARSADGFLDAERELDGSSSPRWLTSEIARCVVHKWRAEEKAILVGANTVQKDNPQLNVRNWCGANPLRIVIDPRLRLGRSYNVFSDGEPTMVFNGIENAQNGTTEYIQIDFRSNPEYAILQTLYERKIQSLIIEGGEFTLKRFIESGLWDEARIFTGPDVFNAGVSAPQIQGRFAGYTTIKNSRLDLIVNPESLKSLAL